MLSRHDISNEDWSRIEHLLPGQFGQHGGVTKIIGCSSMPFAIWPKRESPGRISRAVRASPIRCGSVTTVGAKRASGNRSSRRYKIPTRNGCSSTVPVPVPHKRQRVRKKYPDGSGGQAEQAFWGSRGGFGTKIHAAVTPLGHPVALELTGHRPLTASCFLD